MMEMARRAGRVLIGGICSRGGQVPRESMAYTAHGSPLAEWANSGNVI